jgi:hypothetical protein
MQAHYHSSGHHASQPGKDLAEILSITLESTELILRPTCCVFHEAALQLAEWIG